MRVNSRRKGKVGERAWRDQLRARGWSAKRGQQHDGLEGRDVVCPDLPRYHWEVKFTKSVPLKIYDYLEQAQDDAEEGQIPVAAAKRVERGMNCDWVCVLWAEDLLALVKELEELRAAKPKKRRAARKESLPVDEPGQQYLFGASA